MTQKAEELEMSFTQNKKIDCIEYVSVPVTNEAERIKHTSVPPHVRECYTT